MNWRRWPNVTPINASLHMTVLSAERYVGLHFFLPSEAALEIFPFHFSARFLVGQNLYIYKQSRKSAATNWERAITDWYNEVELFGKERVKPFR